jgi:hypothetical protein
MGDRCWENFSLFDLHYAAFDEKFCRDVINVSVSHATGRLASFTFP